MCVLTDGRIQLTCGLIHRSTERNHFTDSSASSTSLRAHQRRASQAEGGLEEVESEVSRRIAEAAAKINLRDSVTSRSSVSESLAGERADSRRGGGGGGGGALYGAPWSTARPSVHGDLARETFAVTFGDSPGNDDSRRASKSISFFSGLHTRARPSGSRRSSSSSVRASPADMFVHPATWSEPCTAMWCHWLWPLACSAYVLWRGPCTIRDAQLAWVDLASLHDVITHQSQCLAYRLHQS